MYTTQELAIAIKTRAKSSDIVLKDLFIKCGLNSNTMSALYHDKAIAFDSLAKISDELDCSVDYLLGRTLNPQSHRFPSITTGDIKDNHNSVIGNGNSDISITVPADGQAAALLEAFEKLDPFKKAKVLLYVEELSKTE